MQTETHEPAGGSLISRTANLMGTLGINPSANDDIFGGQDNNINTLQSGQNFGGDASKLAQFREEQGLVAKLVYVLGHEDTDVAYQMLNLVRRHVHPGGTARITITFPPIVFATLRLLRRVQRLEFPEPVTVPKSEDEKEPEVKENEDAEDATENASEEEKAGIPEEDSKPDESKEEAEKDNSSPSVDETKEESDDKESANTNDSSAEKMEKADEEKIDASEPSPEVAEEDTSTLFPEFTKAVNCRKILVFLQKTVAMLAPSNPEIAFKLYQEIAVATDLLAHSTQQHFESSSSEFTSIAYDFLTQSFLVYEDEITDSTAQVRAITSIVGTLLTCKTFEKTDYEALITKTAQFSAKLLKKPDQCRMVCLCSRLFHVVGKDVSTILIVVLPTTWVM